MVIEQLDLEEALAFLLYQPGSPYDLHVRAETAAGRIPEAGANGISNGDPNANGALGPRNLRVGGLRLFNSTTKWNFMIENIY